MEKSIEQPLYKMPGIKVAAIPLLCVNLAYLLFILVIAFHNVPQADDYCFMVTLDYHGFFGSMMWWYQNWQGRFMPYIIINAFLFIYERFGTLLPYALFLIFIYLFSIYSLLIKIISPPRSTWNRLFILGLSITVFNTLLLFHLDTATFFWNCTIRFYRFAIYHCTLKWRANGIAVYNWRICIEGFFSNQATASLCN